MPKLTRGAIGAAIAFSVLLIALGLLVPSTTTASSSGSSDGSTTLSTGSQTLVQANGFSVLIVLAIPLVITLLVITALRLDRRPVAWLLTGSLGCFMVLAIMTIGFYILPVFIALAVACATAQPKAAQAVAPGGEWTDR